MVLALLSAGFQSLPPLPMIKLGPSPAAFRVGGLVHALGLCGSLQRTLLWGWEFLLLPRPPQVFSVRGLRLYFPGLEPWVGRSVSGSTRCCLPGQLQLCLPCSTICHLTGSASRHLAMSPLHPSYRSGWVFFFISLVVRLPYSSIFCQFSLFFVFKLLLSFFWLCEEAQYVYLCLHVGRKFLIPYFKYQYFWVPSFAFFLSVVHHLWTISSAHL